MTDEAGVFVALLSGATIAMLAAWWVRWPRAFTVLGVLLTALSAITASLWEPLSTGQTARVVLVLVAAVLAVAGGGPVTVEVFALVDGARPLSAPDGGNHRAKDSSAAGDSQGAGDRPGAGDGSGAGEIVRAGEILRGGAWIGGLERTAIVAALLAGWPEGIALALAVKGLGRYPELRNQDNTGTAERFLIGTFTSVLWAAGCAGIALLLT
ncbi:MAG: hypothetical protein WAW88_07005 [Nocardioides sp.]